MSELESAFQIKSFDDLNEAFIEAKEKFGRRPWWRGQRDGQWKLLPKVHRIAVKHGYDMRYETMVVHRFKTRAEIRHARCPANDDHFAWLSLMRHHGLPTRLLDWTESLLVAAYFAVAGKQEAHPPALFALDPYRLNELRLKSGGYPFSPEHSTIKDLSRDPFICDIHVSSTLAVLAPETDLRMLLQHAVFTIHGSRKPLEHHKHAESLLIKFSIEEPFKERLYEMLCNLGVHRSTLFPDLDRLSQSIEEFEGPPFKP